MVQGVLDLLLRRTGQRAVDTFEGEEAFVTSPSNIVEMMEDVHVQEFADDAFTEMALKDVTFDLRLDKKIPYITNDGHMVAGYFVARRGEVPKFGLAVDVSNTKHWIGVFVHEFNHFRQWQDGHPLWYDVDFKMPGEPQRDVYDLLNEWDKSGRQLSRDQVIKYARMARDLELDCERRTVKTIVDYRLSIDVEEYCQKANSYIFSYSLVPIFGDEWFVDPYDKSELWRHLPKTLDIDHDTEWMKYVDLYWRLCYDPKLEES